MIGRNNLESESTYCFDLHLAHSLILSCGMRSGAGEFPHTYATKNAFMHFRGSSESKKMQTYAVFGVKHESNVGWFGHTVWAWGQAYGLDRLLPQAHGVWRDNDFSEPSGNSAEVKKVPWFKKSHDLLETSFAISFYHSNGILKGRKRVTDQIQELDGQARHKRVCHNIREKVGRWEKVEELEGRSTDDDTSAHFNYSTSNGRPRESNPASIGKERQGNRFSL